MVYASQNLVEFWNVCTRPLEKNGFGLSIAETDAKASLIEQQLRRIADTEAAHREWRRLVVEAGVSGVQVHDARLVATMLSHNIGHILTLNGRDFRRYTRIHALSPEEALAM